MWIFFPLPECLLPVFCLSPLFKVVLTLTALWIITLLWNFAVEKTVAWAEGDFYSIYLEGNQSIALNWTSPVLWKILLWTNRGSFILRAGHAQFKISVIFWTRNKLKFHFWFDMICWDHGFPTNNQFKPKMNFLIPFALKHFRHEIRIHT